MVQQRIWESGLDRSAERGELTRAQIYARILDALGGHIDETALRTAWSSAFVPQPDVLWFAKSLPSVALLTNNGPLLDDCFDHELADVAACFRQRFLSWRIGARKPDQRVFRHVEEYLGLEPCDLALVDDDPENVRAARQHGWKASTLFTALAPLAASADHYR